MSYFSPSGVTAERALSLLRGPCRTEFSKPVRSAGIFCAEGITPLRFAQTGPLRMSPLRMSARGGTYMCSLCLSTPSRPWIS